MAAVLLLSGQRLMSLAEPRTPGGGCCRINFRADAPIPSLTVFQTGYQSCPRALALPGRLRILCVQTKNFFFPLRSNLTGVFGVPADVSSSD